MKRVYVGDCEANGLLREATKMHCAVFKNVYTGEIVKFWPWEGADYVKQMLSFLDTVDVLIIHNGIGYDWPLWEKLYGYKFKGQKVDTLIMSRLLNPKRLVPFNCPNRGIGPHSVEAWGYRVGRGKPEHNDWEKYSEAMLHRCTEDVEIQHLIFKALEQEYSGKNWKNAFKLSFKLFEYLQKQEQYGWLVDQEHMHSCIHQLEHWIARIDKVLDKHLPLIVDVEESKEKGEYKYIKKPFLKSGEYSASVENWFNHHALDSASRLVGGPFSRINLRKVDLNSNDETKDYLLKSGWEPLEWNVNDEGERTSPKLSKDDPFEGITGGIGRLVAKRVQCRQRKSIIEGLFGIIREDGRIASVINNLATTARATHRGIVNIPKASSFYGKQMRKIFTSKEGFVLVGTDSDACQLRMLAGRMNNPEYIEAMVNGDKKLGTDNHSITARIGELESRDIAKNVMYCVPMDTQVLTRRGWKTRDALNIGDMVLTYNQQFNCKEWKPILALHEKEDEVVQLSHGHGFKVRATKDHRWFVKQRRYDPFNNPEGIAWGRYMDAQTRTTDELNKESNIITNAPMLYDQGVQPLKWNTPKYTTDWTEAVCMASSKERSAFLAGFLIADGCYQNNKWTFSQNDGGLYDAALAAAFIESDGFIHVSTQGKVKLAKLSKKPHVTMMNMQREVLPKQKVWCLSTENESFVIRQGDTVTITGNCLLFGGGDVKLAKTAKKPHNSGAELRSKLYRGLDGLGDLVEKLTKEWQATAKRRFNAQWNRMEYFDGYITGLDGRPIYVPYEHQLLVYLLQSDEAIMMSAAYIRANQQLERMGYVYGKDYGFTAWYHDEYTIECREALAPIVASVAEQAIEWAGRFFNIPCPHKGQAAIGRNWYDIH